MTSVAPFYRRPCTSPPSLCPLGMYIISMKSLGTTLWGCGLGKGNQEKGYNFVLVKACPTLSHEAESITMSVDLLFFLKEMVQFSNHIY